MTYKVLSSDPNNSSDWLFIPKLGLRLLNPKVSDIGQYMCLGSMNIETAIQHTDEEFTVYVKGIIKYKKELYVDICHILMST
jgi:hypothetical protein